MRRICLLLPDNSFADDYQKIVFQNTVSFTGKNVACFGNLQVFNHRTNASSRNYDGQSQCKQTNFRIEIAKKSIDRICYFWSSSHFREIRKCPSFNNTRCEFNQGTFGFRWINKVSKGNTVLFQQDYFHRISTVDVHIALKEQSSNNHWKLLFF